MKKIYSLFAVIVICIIGINSANSAPLTGTKNIPGSYATLAAAITDLNLQGVGAGGVILNLLATNPQNCSGRRICNRWCRFSCSNFHKRGKSRYHSG